ncbi:hypothetical protein IMG5_112780 [Ichthyophthirius multifiliis]|uniref:Uncharacterized protein n=1 Tax=Ichthyophthirius multifiliis TaxID=5932 RepID=G0QTY2_ICHMU|nr:hypothetical protein IMG5_112780 [Ichthyophthirius multifiliis]EGR31341.1 hypothetical protein IMG5_112780 [Ichthyophthirius multifiliis]|eukprot:XP_004034827.1 hypothetical protein IMG5_112780 [Ichthyophthirius multifiliis]
MSNLLIKKESPLILISRKQIDEQKHEFSYEAPIPELKELQKGFISTYDNKNTKEVYDQITEIRQIYEKPEFITKKAITGKETIQEEQSQKQTKEKTESATIITQDNREQCIKEIKRYIKENQDSDKLTLNYLRNNLQFQPKNEFKEIIEKLCYKVTNSLGDNVYKLK